MVYPEFYPVMVYLKLAAASAVQAHAQHCTAKVKVLPTTGGYHMADVEYV